MTLALLIFTVSAIFGIILVNGRGNSFARVGNFEMQFLFAITALYALPLPIAVILGNEGGNISVHLGLFESWLELALFYTSGFILSAAIFYRILCKGKLKKIYWRNIKPVEARNFKITWILIFGISIALVGVLAREVGGITNLILSGYRVTELFVGRGYLAISFEWLFSLSLVQMCYGIVAKKRSAIMWAAILAGLLLIVMAAMGRRGFLTLMILSFAYLAMQVGWITKPFRLFLPLVIAFIFMNWLGLVRGESYENFIDLINLLVIKTIELGESGQLITGLFYTITSGQFVVPFEVLPQLMRTLSFSQDYWLGWSIPQSLSLLVPTFILESRPLPLANWYMDIFYGDNYGLNEGRQFFFLGEAYLNFGWFGFIIWGLLISGIIHYFTKQRQHGTPYWELAFRSLFFGSIVTFIATDTTGFFVSFLKGIGFVPIIFAFANKITK